MRSVRLSLPTWKVPDILSNMENTARTPTAEEASAALRDAEGSRARLAHSIAVPSWFFTSMGAAVGLQMATTALGLGDDARWARGALVAGLAVLLAVSGVQLSRFRRLNGVWLGGFASRVVLGTGTAASASYAVTATLAIWAALAGRWWLVAPASLAGGAAYALSGRLWLRSYRSEPARHSRGEPAVWLVALAIAALAGLALLVLER
jgi:hypothetical protein